MQEALHNRRFSARLSKLCANSYELLLMKIEAITLREIQMPLVHFSRRASGALTAAAFFC